MIEKLKDHIAWELNNPRSDWTHAELFARLKHIEEGEDHVKFIISCDHPDNCGVLPGLEF